MKHKLILAALLLAIQLCTPAFGQTLKMTNGISVSSLEWGPYNLFKDKVTGYSGTIGLDYLEKKYFYLSSELGYVETGGKEEGMNFANATGHVLDDNVEINLGYIHLNTTFRVRYPFNKFQTYLGIGPKLDIPISTTADFFGVKTSNLKILPGLKPEAGVAYDVNKFRIGLNAAYLLNFGRIDNTHDDFYKTFSKTFLFSLSVGYKL